MRPMLDSSAPVESPQPWWATVGHLTLNHTQAFLKEFLDELVGESDADDSGVESPVPEVVPIRATQSTPLPDPLSDERPLIAPPYIPPVTSPQHQSSDPEAIPLTAPPRITPVAPVYSRRNPTATPVHILQKSEQRGLSLPPELHHWKNWKLIFPAYDHRRVQRFLWSHRTNSLHPFFGYNGNEAVIDPTLRIVQ